MQVVSSGLSVVDADPNSMAGAHYPNGMGAFFRAFV